MLTGVAALKLVMTSIILKGALYALKNVYLTIFSNDIRFMAF